MNHTGPRLAACLGLFCLTSPQIPAHSLPEGPPDLVIRGGRVMDPESGLDAVRNIGIRGGIITSVSTESIAGGAEIDATGLVVAPGFIDTDGFTENARMQVRDGVTSVFDIRQGTSDVARWYAEREGKLLINFGVGVGYTRVRTDVMGETRRAAGTRTKKPSETQITEILRRVDREFAEGAVALGMGISGEADPTGWEHIEAFRIAAGMQAHVVAILRDENWAVDSNIAAYLSQMIGAGVVSGASIHIPHLNSSAGPHTPRLLQIMTRARARGVQITAETAPYLAGMIRIHPGEMERWSDREIREIQPLGADERLTRETAARYRDKQFLAFAHNDLVEPRLEPALTESVASPLVSIASHGSDAVWMTIGPAHPTTFGAFSRTLGYYVRERRVLSLMEALRKMTLMPARRLEARVPAMRNKGRIRDGADADIVVFDADRIIDRATFRRQLPSEGVRYVLVNGGVVVRNGVVQEPAFAGRPLRASAGPEAGGLLGSFSARLWWPL